MNILVCFVFFCIISSDISDFSVCRLFWFLFDRQGTSSSPLLHTEDSHLMRKAKKCNLKFQDCTCRTQPIQKPSVSYIQSLFLLLTIQPKAIAFVNSEGVVAILPQLLSSTKSNKTKAPRKRRCVQKCVTDVLGGKLIEDPYLELQCV